MRITKTDLEKRVRSLERDNTLTHAALQAAVEGRIDWIGKRADAEGNTYRFDRPDRDARRHPANPTHKLEDRPEALRCRAVPR